MSEPTPEPVTDDDGTRHFDGWAEPPLPDDADDLTPRERLGQYVHPAGDPYVTDEQIADDEREHLAADAPPGDTYGREQAARVLGVSPRRVSQLAADGRLDVVQAKPLRLAAESVHAMRAERSGKGRDVRANMPPPDAVVSVAAEVERVVTLVVAEHRRAIEAGEHLLAEVTASRDDARAEVERLRADLAHEREAVERERIAREAAEARANAPRRKWWQR